ncbi:MAG TPA: hypothetical protein VGL61_24460 [Kofleriaceae bacterium]|jgi:hypothetical protein
MDKADAAARVLEVLPNIEKLVAGAEADLADAIRDHARRAKLERHARMVRRMRLTLVRFELLTKPDDAQLTATRAMWEAMSEDEIVAMYTRP